MVDLKSDLLPGYISSEFWQPIVWPQREEWPTSSRLRNY